MKDVTSQPVVGAQTKLAEHVNRLAADAGVATYLTPDFRYAASNRRLGVVQAPPVDTVKDYYVWLHEFGHLYHQHEGRSRGSRALLEQEAEAWRWALANGEVSPDGDTYKLAAHAVDTYGTELPPWAWPQEYASVRAELHELARSA